jgi:hypothetical protein
MEDAVEPVAHPLDPVEDRPLYRHVDLVVLRVLDPTMLVCEGSIIISAVGNMLRGGRGEVCVCLYSPVCIGVCVCVCVYEHV